MASVEPIFSLIRSLFRSQWSIPCSSSDAEQPKSGEKTHFDEKLGNARRTGQTKKYLPLFMHILSLDQVSAPEHSRVAHTVVGNFSRFYVRKTAKNSDFEQSFADFSVMRCSFDLSSWNVMELCWTEVMWKFEPNRQHQSRVLAVEDNLTGVAGKYIFFFYFFFIVTFTIVTSYYY